MAEFVLEGVENIIGKGEKAFPLFLECFQKASFLGVVKAVEIFGKAVST